MQDKLYKPEKQQMQRNKYKKKAPSPMIWPFVSLTKREALYY